MLAKWEEKWYNGNQCIIRWGETMKILIILLVSLTVHASFAWTPIAFDVFKWEIPGDQNEIDGLCFGIARIKADEDKEAVINGVNLQLYGNLHNGVINGVNANLGLLSFVTESNGFNASWGLCNFATKSKGVLLGLLSSGCAELKGLQVSAINIIGWGKGAQVGLVNFAPIIEKKEEGDMSRSTLQVGLLNWNGRLLLPLINWAY